MSESVFDVISIEGITARGLHGVYPQEREKGQEFSVDIQMTVDTRVAAVTDDLTYTVDYSQVAVEVSRILQGTPVNLLETLADTIARRILAFPRVQAVSVQVHKPQAPLGVPFSDLTLSIHRNQSDIAATSQISPQPTDLSQTPQHPVTVAIALGANLGQAPQTMARAITALDEHAGINVVGVSGLYRTAPILLPGAPHQPDYFNAVAEIQTLLSPLRLLQTLHELEAAAGRVRTEKWQARPLDLDILTYGDIVSNDPQLILPHPRAHERAFVLQPWTQVNPQATLGAHGRVAVLAQQVSDQQIELLAEQWVLESLAGEFPQTEPPAALNEDDLPVEETGSIRQTYREADEAATESPIFASFAAKRAALQTEWILTKHQVDRDWEMTQLIGQTRREVPPPAVENTKNTTEPTVETAETTVKKTLPELTVTVPAKLPPLKTTSLRSDEQPATVQETAADTEEVSDFEKIVMGLPLEKKSSVMRMPSWKRVVIPPQPRIVDEPTASTPGFTVEKPLTADTFANESSSESSKESEKHPAETANTNSDPAPQWKGLRRRQILRPAPTGAIPVVPRPSSE